MGLNFHAVDGFNVADDVWAASVPQLEGDLIKMSISFGILWESQWHEMGKKTVKQKTDSVLIAWPL